jgi:hypothetical protein
LCPYFQDQLNNLPIDSKVYNNFATNAAFSYSIGLIADEVQRLTAAATQFRTVVLSRGERICEQKTYFKTDFTIWTNLQVISVLNFVLVNMV